MGNSRKWHIDNDISMDRLRELEAVARRYEEMQEKEKKLRRGEIDRRKAENVKIRAKDPTENTAIMPTTKSELWKIRAIEESAKEASNASEILYDCIMKNVTKGKSFEIIQPPIGRVQFYHMRQRFFMELDKRI